MDDINLLKGRMSEALVEGIFKRAQYMVARVARETQVSALMRTGQTVPDFVVWKALDEPSLGHRSYLLLAIEVKYCANLDDYLRRETPARSPEVALQWPELYEILVTERPELGRSCFQAVHVSILPPAAPPSTLDLHLVPGLDIYRRTVEEYEGLVREVFPLIGSRNGGSQNGDWARKLGAWAPARHESRSDARIHQRSRPVGDHGSRPGDRGYRPSAAHEQRHGVSE
ncbi:MAG TPA: hypothetical protein VFX87_11020 [Methylomirabilota bacterium]|nr:hypothetical protein [Methylomirabilota bacterium]